MKEIILNSLLGGLFFGLFTYLVNTFKKNPNFLKLSAFLWAAPLTFFYIMFIMRSKSTKTIIAFTKHVLVGITLSVIVYIMSFCLMSNCTLQTLMILNLIIVTIAIFIYFNYKVYELI